MRGGLLVVLVLLALATYGVGAPTGQVDRPRREHWLATFTPGPSPTALPPDPTRTAQCGRTFLQGRRVVLQLLDGPGCD